MTQAEIDKMIKDGIAKGIKELQEADDDAQKGDNFFDVLKESAGKAGEGANNFIKVFEGLVKAEATYSKDKVAARKKELGYYFDARKSIGGIAITAELGEERMVGLAKASVEGTKMMGLAAVGASKDQLAFADGAMGNLKPMIAFFDSAEGAMKKYSAIFDEIATKTPRAAKALGEASDLTRQAVTFFGQTLDLADESTAKILQRQYAFQGEVSEKILGDIANTSIALMRTTGLGANSLKKDIVDIIEDTDRFGDIGVKSAGRIAAGLGQLGIDFQTFTRMTDSFMDFDSAASKMGELSALFGIQMDAMEMTYLANEDQEEFLFRMREEIMDSGVDVENMSNTRARALANQMNMSVVQMKTFLKDGELEFDQGELVDTTDATDQMDALTTAGKYFGDETTRSAEDTAQIMKDVLLPSVIANEGALLRSADSANKLNNSFKTMQIPDDVRTSLNELQAFSVDTTILKDKAKQAVVEAGIDAFKVGLSDVADNAIDVATKVSKTAIVEVTKALTDAGFGTKSIDEYTRIISESKGVGADGFSVLGEAYDANFTRYVQEIATTQTAFDEITTDLKSHTGNMSELIADFKTKGDQMARLATALEKGETVQISLQVDGKTIAQSTQAFFKGQGQAIVLTSQT